MKSFALAIAAAATILASGTASSDVIKVDVGPTLNPFFLRLTCNDIAASRGGSVVKSERSGVDKTGVCFIDIPRRGITFTPGKPTPGIVATPGGVVRQPIPIAPKKPEAKLEMVDAGRLWSQDHATERCRALAIRKGGTWTGIWKKHGVNSKAQCQLKVIPKPVFVVKAVDAGRIWNNAHAKQQCTRIATENGGTWTGIWKNDPDNFNKPVCMVKVKAEPEGVVKRFKTTKIWNDAHAKQRCNQIAKANNGQWLGVWRNLSNGETGSVCMIKVSANHQSTQQSNHQTTPVNLPATISPSISVRNVKAGAIWDQAHAERKCPVVAQSAKGTWTRRWSKVGSGNESVCEVRFQSINGGTTTRTPVQPTANTRTRNVAAGSIWDDKQAKSKCPVVAANNKAKWTGNWTKTGPGHISVCEISVIVTTNTPQAQSSQSNTSTIREVAAGGIWDQAQASRKCPVVAANNKARWTGRWRKVNANNDAVCEIDTRI